MPRKWLFSIVCVSLSLFGWAQDAPLRAEGRITGVVLMEAGQPAANVKVCTAISMGNNGTRIPCNATTDNEGRFTLEHLKAGTYHVFAINEAEGYSTQNQMPGQEVTIDANQPWPNVTITIRQNGRDGILVGSVTDKLTGRVIRNATVQYKAIDRHGEAGEGGFANLTGLAEAVPVPVPVPSNCDLLVVIRAKGYRDWVYADPSDSTRPTLRLEPGERKILDVQLEPLPDGQSSQ